MAPRDPPSSSPSLSSSSSASSNARPASPEASSAARSAAPLVAFTATAYSKMVMHASKHTQDAVNGILLGRLLPPPSNNAKKEERQQTILCVDTVPLFHSFILPPMMSCAFELVEELCAEGRRRMARLRAGGDGASEASEAEAEKEKEETPVAQRDQEGDLRVVGYYHCNLVTPPTPESVAEPSTVAAMAATTVQEKYPNAIFCMVRMPETSAAEAATNAVTAERKASREVKVYRMQSDKWRLVAEPHDVVVSEAARYITMNVIRDATYMGLKDMDDHLFDPSLSPANLSLLCGYEELLEKDREELCSVGVAAGADDIGLAGIPL
ncbi:hypothetical protein BESB_004320 [Besnoitia besnoiti]|uniref:Family UPF0172 protein n=1 Tax=Besnoitia besnoiti TaxID=94643 RepID=A0A2A9MNH4_BESBE|nr:hypothetical protein BESB_004320 [Besnoitia besnoiti]PFH38091.1 hypothetical protein BESB_004320 [Besnoitia besnoiti]